MAESADNCGTGGGGFKPGNKCQKKGEGGQGGGGKEEKKKTELAKVPPRIQSVVRQAIQEGDEKKIESFRKMASEKGIDAESVLSSLGHGRPGNDPGNPDPVLPTPTRKAGQSLTDTKEFKAWFGDSKIVGEDGKPEVLFHATSSSNDFTEFNNPFHEKASGWNYFTDRPAYAERMIGGGANDRILPVFVKMENPVDLSGMSHRDVTADQFRKALEGHGIDTSGMEISGKKALFEHVVNPANREKMIAECKKAGYDGIVFPDVHGDVKATSHVTFDAEQIKSAIGNRGTFDPKSKDITK